MKDGSNFGFRNEGHPIGLTTAWSAGFDWSNRGAKKLRPFARKTILTQHCKNPLLNAPPSSLPVSTGYPHRHRSIPHGRVFATDLPRSCDRRCRLCRHRRPRVRSHPHLLEKLGFFLRRPSRRQRFQMQPLRAAPCYFEPPQPGPLPRSRDRPPRLAVLIGGPHGSNRRRRTSRPKTAPWARGC